MIKKLKKEKEQYWGDLSEVCGDLTGVRGDLDDCEITDEDRKRGIDIFELIKEQGITK